MHRDRHNRLARLRARTWLVPLVCVVIGGLIGLSSASASTSAAKAKAKKPSGTTTKVLHLCVSKSTGAARVVGLHARCARSERSLTLDNRAPGPVGPAGPTGPANTEVVQGPSVTLVGSAPSGSIATSTAGCDKALNGANREAYGGGVSVVPHPTTATPDILSIESSYPGDGVTGQSAASLPAAGTAADAYTGTVAISRMFSGDTATVQAYVICGP
jgi:hypothetical protein